jgi:hypothetical protein
MKRKIATAELARLIMIEIRRRPECSHIESVEFKRPIQQSPRDPNWAPAFSCDTLKLAPQVAYAIAARFPSLYDLG